MNKQEVINEIVKRIKRNDLIYSIKNYLKSLKFTDENIEDYINEAKAQIKNRKRKTLPKKNKLIFGSLIFTAIVSFILFFFILPKQNYTTYTLICIAGAIIFVLSSLMAYFYRGSWKPEQIELQLDAKGNSDYSILLVLGIIPSVIFYFIFSWHFESVQKDILKATQVDAVGTIISGTSLTTRSLDLSEVMVTFTTKEGKKITTKKKLYDYEFKKYYKGQQVPLIYSSSNPKVIELLTSQHRIEEYKRLKNQ